MRPETASRRPSPDIWPSRGLWSLLDMLKLDAKEFIVLLHQMMGIEQTSRAKNSPGGKLPATDQANAIVYGTQMHERLAALELPVSAKVAKEMVAGAKTYETFNGAINQLWNTLALEIEGRQFYGPMGRYLGYFEQPKLFGDAVFEHFPSANNDIFEAGTCLALERSTACVMHLMRVVEVGLIALATRLGVKSQAGLGRLPSRDR